MRTRRSHCPCCAAAYYFRTRTPPNPPYNPLACCGWCNADHTANAGPPTSVTLSGSDCIGSFTVTLNKTIDCGDANGIKYQYTSTSLVTGGCDASVWTLQPDLTAFIECTIDGWNFGYTHLTTTQSVAFIWTTCFSTIVVIPQVVDNGTIYLSTSCSPFDFYFTGPIQTASGLTCQPNTICTTGCSGTVILEYTA